MSWLWQPFGEAAGTGDQTVTANLLTVTASLPNATVTPGGVSVSTNLLTVTASLPNATVTTQNTITAQLLTVTASLPNATITTGNVNIATNLLTVTASLPNATVTSQYTVTANLLTVTASLPNATVTNVSAINTNLLTVTASLPNATITPGGVTVTAQLLSVTATLPNATVTAAATITANLLSVSVSLPNATVTPGNVTVAANLLTVTATLPNATISSGLSLTNGMEGSDETTLTSGSGGNTTSSGNYFDVVNGSGTAPDAIVFDTAQFHGGSSSVRMDSTNTGNEYVEWTTQFIDQTGTVWVRAYVYFSSAPGGADKIIRLFDSGGSEVAFFRIDNARNPGIGDTVTFTEPGGPVTLATSTWHRLEMEVPIGNSVTITGRVFTGANLDGTTPDNEWTQATSDTDLGNANIATIRFGNSIAGCVIWMDDVGASNVGWIGPAAAGDQTITANLLSVSASLPNATLTPGGVSISANLLTVTASLPNATISTQNTIAANLLSVSASLPNATVTPGGVSVTANLLTVTASLPNATISQAGAGDQSFTAELLTVTASFPNATITTGNVNISANRLTVTASFPLATFTGGVVTHILRNNFNVGPDETQLSGGSGGNTTGGGDYFDTINGGASPTPGDRVVYSSAEKAHGTFSVLCDSNSSGGEYVEWNTQWTDETVQVDVRFYMRIITFPSSAANKMMRMFDSTGAEVAYFRVDAAQQPGIGDSTATFVEPAGPVTLSANTWYRVEMHVPIGNSVTITCDMFDGANMDGSSPDHSWTMTGADTLTVGTNVASIRWGNSIAGTETYFDDVGIRNDGTAFGASSDTATIVANLLTVTASLPGATITATATIAPQTLTWTTTLPLASFSQITQITGDLLTAAPSFPLATLSITGDQTVDASLLTVAWQVPQADILLGTTTRPGTIVGAVLRQ